MRALIRGTNNIAKFPQQVIGLNCEDVVCDPPTIGRLAAIDFTRLDPVD